MREFERANVFGVIAWGVVFLTFPEPIIIIIIIITAIISNISPDSCQGFGVVGGALVDAPANGGGAAVGMGWGVTLAAGVLDLFVALWYISRHREQR